MTLNDFSRELQELGNHMDKGLSQERTTMALHQLLITSFKKVEELENRLEKLEDWASYLKYEMGSFLRGVDRRD